MALSDCRFEFPYFQGAVILFICVWAASPKFKLPLSKLCFNLNSRGWNVSGELNELPFPSESCSPMGTVFLSYCSPWALLVWYTWEPCEPSQQPSSYSSGIKSCSASSAFTLTRTIYRANILCENKRSPWKTLLFCPLWNISIVSVYQSYISSVQS